MSSKEKAFELVTNYYSLITGMQLSFLSKLTVMPNGDSYYETAKKCAISSVNEIIKVINNDCMLCKQTKRDYWKEVKQEIDKL